MNIRDLLAHCHSAGHSFRVRCDGELDYSGNDTRKALEALNACDEMQLSIVDGATGKRKGWVLYIPSLDQDERIADYCGEYLEQLLG